MSKYLLILLVLIALVDCTADPKLYQKIIHNTDPEAKCLDGSPGFVYVNEGGDTKNIMIYFLGGGMCGSTSKEATLESCYQRSKDFLGSSKPWPAILPSELAQGYLSTDPKVSPFANWTKIFLPYCDGSLHQGYTKDPIKYKDASLYFRGSLITRSHIAWIQSKYNLKGANKIVLTGMSAGGIAVNSWTNYVKNFVENDSKVYPISDSGIFLNFQTRSGQWLIQEQTKNIVAVANVDQLPPTNDCNQNNPGQEWKCLFIQNNHPYIRGRFMVVNSEYDAWAIPNLMRIGCLKQGVSGQTLSNCSESQMDYIEDYRQAYRDLLYRWITKNQYVSVWSIACSQHVYAAYKDFYDSPHQKIPALTGKTVKDAINSYVLENKLTIIYDEDGWPSNTGCAK